jgi:hypothetical protein
VPAATRKNISPDRILSGTPNVYGARSDDPPFAELAMESMMERTLIRYRTKPEMTDKNAELIAGVFAELKTAQPDGVRYLSLRLDDGSFIHFVETEASDGSSALPGMVSCKAFQSGIRERCAEPPQIGGVTIVGNYRMLGQS